MGRKFGTKAIHKVITSGGEYYAYDVAKEDGKTKRLYAHTEQELVEKIKAYEEGREYQNSFRIPSVNDVQAFVKFYFVSAVGKISPVKLKKLAAISKTVLIDSPFGKRDISEITPLDIEDYLKETMKRLPLGSVKDLDETLRRTFELTNSLGRTSISYPEISLTKESVTNNSSPLKHYPSHEEIQKLIDYCVYDDCSSVKNSPLIVFCFSSGVHITDAVDLTPDNFHMSEKVVQIGARSVPLSDWLCEYLRDKDGRGIISLTRYRYNSENGIYVLKSPSCEWAFPKYTGEKQNSNNIHKSIQIIVNKCGMDKRISAGSVYKAILADKYSSGIPVAELEREYGLTKAQIKRIYDSVETARLLDGM